MITSELLEVIFKIQQLPLAKPLLQELTSAARRLVADPGSTSEVERRLRIALTVSPNLLALLVAAGTSNVTSGPEATTGEFVLSDRLALETRLPAGAAQLAGFAELEVVFATDRALVQTEDGQIAFSGEQGPLQFGASKVSIPDDHRVGSLEAPRLWRFEFRADPTKHVVLRKTELLSREALRARAGELFQVAGVSELLLFVHGYNVTFEDAVCRTAQLAFDLEFRGLPMLFSWPSAGKVKSYLHDENNAIYAQTHFREILVAAMAEFGADRIYVIAHSMGNRLLADALERLRSDGKDDRAQLSEAILAAPDVDANAFRLMAPAFARYPSRRTLYTSSNDKTMALSKSAHGCYPRAGDAGSGIVVVDSVDTIDASLVATDFLGHSYYGDNRSIIADIFGVIRGKKIDERPHLRAVSLAGKAYWEMRP